MSTVSADKNDITVGDAVLSAVRELGEADVSDVISLVKDRKETTSANIRNELSKLTKRGELRRTDTGVYVIGSGDTAQEMEGRDLVLTINYFVEETGDLYDRVEVYRVRLGASPEIGIKVPLARIAPIAHTEDLAPSRSDK